MPSVYDQTNGQKDEFVSNVPKTSGVTKAARKTGKQQQATNAAKSLLSKTSTK
jgi:hypothetical protein